MTVRVFLVDDHEIMRRGIGELINAESDLEVIGEAGTSRQALARIAATVPDIAILDVRLPDGSGIDLCRSVRSAFPTVACLILTAFDDDQASYAAVLAGAAGYVLKDIRGARLVEDIRRVAAGGSLVDRSTQENILSLIHAKVSGSATPELTARERRVLELITDGLTNRQIGTELALAEKTVRNYVSALFAKLGMERRTQAAVFGAQLRVTNDGAQARHYPV